MDHRADAKRLHPGGGLAAGTAPARATRASAAGFAPPAQRALDSAIQRSPRMSAQRRQLRRAFGPAGSAAPVQAKIGFELETENRVDKWQGGEWRPYGRHKGEPMYSGAGFDVEADTHDNPEFIFHPQENKAAITAAADEATDFCDAMRDAYEERKGAFGPNHAEDSFRDTADGWQGDFRLHVTDALWTADGQSTLGVLLQDIPQYIRHVLPRTEVEAFDARLAGVADDERSADVQGLLALMIQFVADFARWQGENNDEGPKNAQAYMNRNSFDKMLRSMGAQQVAEFRALFHGVHDAWRPGNPVSAATGVGGDARVIPNRYLDSDEHRIQNMTTLRAWVDSMLATVGAAQPVSDLMSPPQGWRGGNYGMALMDMDTDSVPDSALALFEYRHTDNRTDLGETDGKNLPVYEWGPWMEERFDKAIAWNGTLQPDPAVAPEGGDAQDDGGG